MTERLVVIGGDAAGLAAASQARKRRAAADLEIVAFEKGGYASYSACGIPYLIAGDVAGPDRLIAREPAVFRDKQAIDLRMHSEVTAIDVHASTVTVHDWTTGKEFPAKLNGKVLLVKNPDGQIVELNIVGKKTSK